MGEQASLLGCKADDIMVRNLYGYQLNDTKKKKDTKFIQYGSLKDKDIIQPNLRLTAIVLDLDYREIHLFLSDEVMYYITSGDIEFEDGLI